MTIQQLSHEIGISIDTLRIWERRYGFPVPGRDARGHRSYSVEQVEELRIVKSLQNFGQRPGKIFSLLPAQRRELLDKLSSQSLPKDTELHRLAYELGPDRIALELDKQRQRMKLVDFIHQYAVPLLQFLDHGWTSGQISIAREHLISDQLKNLLRSELTGHTVSKGSSILFLTLSGERHKLGLLLAAVLFEHAGVPAIWLSEELPLSEVPALAADLGVKGLALSFSGHYSLRQAKQDLSSLRKDLDPAIKIIAGGHAVQQIYGLPNLLICTDLRQIPQITKRHFLSVQKRKVRT
jgi:DNA-binding transcriptional MerR regulator